MLRILGTLTILSSQNILASPTTMGFRVLSYEGELIKETELSPSSQKNDFKSLSHQGFTSLQIHADFDRINKTFRFVAGKPWNWCYHIYDRVNDAKESGLEWKGRRYKLNRDKCLNGLQQNLDGGELIEWLPCRDFKIEFD